MNLRMRILSLWTVAIIGCPGSIEVQGTGGGGFGGIGADGGAGVDAGDGCLQECDTQIDCLKLGLVSPDPCEEWGCPGFGECGHHCQLSAIWPGQVCLGDAGMGTCTEDGICVQQDGGPSAISDF